MGILNEKRCKKEFYDKGKISYVYLRINNDKDYFLVYKKIEIQIQTLLYLIDYNTVIRIEGHQYCIA